MFNCSLFVQSNFNKIILKISSKITQSTTFTNSVLSTSDAHAHCTLNEHKVCLLLSHPTPTPYLVAVWLTVYCTWKFSLILVKIYNTWSLFKLLLQNVYNILSLKFI